MSIYIVVEHSLIIRKGLWTFKLSVFELGIHRNIYGVKSLEAQKKGDENRCYENNIRATLYIRLNECKIEHI